MSRSLTRSAFLICSRQFASLRDQARKVNPKYIYEPEFKDPRIYPTLPTINVRLQSYDYVELELFQAYVDKIAKRFKFDIVESYAVAAKTEQCVTYKPNSTIVDSEVELSIYDRVVRLDNVYAVHLPQFVTLLRTHLPVGVKMTVKEHEKADEDYRYIPDILLKQKQEELKALDDPIIRRNLGWE